MSASSVTVRLLGPADAAALGRVTADVFDGPVDPGWAAEFLADARHHLAVALADGEVVGMASAVRYVHPDKPPALWVDEVGVTPAYQRRGVGRCLLEALFARGRELGCAEAWVGTEPGDAARALYSAVGGVEEPEPAVIVTFRLLSGP